MSRYFFLTILLLFSGQIFALVGLDRLSQNLFQKNLDISAIEKNIESKEFVKSASNSVYYPTLNAVGSYGQNKTDDLLITEKGYTGYLEGKMNLFRGFKDQSIAERMDVDLEISKIDLEIKKRELRLELTEVASDMILFHKLEMILAEEYKTILAQKQMAAKKVAAGLTGAVDNLEFELRTSEIQIEQKQIQQKHQETHQKFVKLYGADFDDSNFQNLDFSAIEQLSKPISDLKADNANLEYRKNDLIRIKSELDKSEIKADFMPTLDLLYSFGRLTPSEDSPTRFNESKYAVQLTIPLFSGFDTYYKTKAASFNVQSAEKIKFQKNLELNSKYQILKNKMSELSSLYSINEAKIINTKKYFDLTLSEYKRGIKNSPDMVNATDRLFLTKKKKIELLKDLEITKVQIENFN
jgi:outer membrane protein